MSVDNRCPSSIRGVKPDKSGSIEPNDGLSRFDTRNNKYKNKCRETTNVDKDNNDNNSEIHKKPYDPDGILECQPVLKCIFCNKYETAIEFDMELHLHEKHRLELLTQYPLKGKGYTMDVRIGYFINRIKLREKIKQLETIQTTPAQPWQMTS